MIHSGRIWFKTLIIFVVLSHSCLADMAILTEEELGDFVAEEGVCDIRLPDTCNTDPVVMATRSMGNENVNQTLMSARANADLANAIRTGQINTSDMAFMAARMVVENMPMSYYEPPAFNKLPTFTVFQPPIPTLTNSATITQFSPVSAPPLGTVQQSPPAPPDGASLYIFAH